MTLDLHFLHEETPSISHLSIQFSVYLMEKRHRIPYGVWDRRVLIFHISTLYPTVFDFDFTSCSLPLKTLILLDYLMFSY